MTTHFYGDDCDPPHAAKIGVIVNGQPTVVEVQPTDSVSTLIPKALRQTGNHIYGPEERWELRTLQGAIVEPDDDLARHAQDDPYGPPLYLNLRAGWGANV